MQETHLMNEFMLRAEHTIKKIIGANPYTPENINEVYDIMLFSTKYSDHLRKALIMRKASLLNELKDKLIIKQ